LDWWSFGRITASISSIRWLRRKRNHQIRNDEDTLSSIATCRLTIRWTCVNAILIFIQNPDEYSRIQVFHWQGEQRDPHVFSLQHRLPHSE
jgi:hypothetical protein